MALSEAAKEQRRQYQRQWNQQNPEKRREYINRYWEKKATTAAGGRAGKD